MEFSEEDTKLKSVLSDFHTDLHLAGKYLPDKLLS